VAEAQVRRAALAEAGLRAGASPEALQRGIDAINTKLREDMDALDRQRQEESDREVERAKRENESRLSGLRAYREEWRAFQREQQAGFGARSTNLSGTAGFGFLQQGLNMAPPGGR